MNRRYFVMLGIYFTAFTSKIFSFDYRKINADAWQASSIDVAAEALYGKKKFASIQKSTNIQLIVPSVSIIDSQNIPIVVHSSLKAKSVAIFVDTTPKSLIAVFSIGNDSVLNYELMIRMDIKGTIFAVLEDLNEKLHYTREYIDIVALSCTPSEE